ncbi:MAG TPA: peptidylprolyl isomerase [Bacteroidales bacterium]|nr:peptidylprolyl isomerase [Bacteroidales bacterium]
MRTTIRIFMLSLLIGSAFLLQAQNKLDKKVLMTIAEEPVTVKEFMDVYGKNNVNNQVIDQKSLEEYLELYINFKLKVKEAESLKMDTAKAFLEELEGYRKQLAKPYFTNEKVSEALLKEAYDRKLQDVRASHILLRLDKNALPEDTLRVYQKAMELRKRILAGEDFADVAAEASEDPSARDREEIPGKQSFRPGNKGDLGYFSVFDMVYPFENGAYNTPVDEISMPVRSDFGYHLIKVTERSPATGTIEVAHIYLSLPINAPDSLDQEKSERIQRIYEEIKGGMKFEEAVKAYSEDRGSAQRDGKLSKFTVNRIVPEFVETVKTLEVDEISKPVRTVYGYHIIKLIGTEAPGSFEEEKAKLSERLAKDSRAQKSEQAVIAQIKKENGFKANEANLQSFISQLDSTFVSGKWEASEGLSNDNSLFKLGKKNYTNKDFIAFVKSKQSKQENLNAAQYARQLFAQFTDQSCLNYEDSQLERKYPEFAALMEEYRDGILLFDLMDKEVWSKAVKDTTGLEAFYEAHKNNYMWGERADATVYTITKEDDVTRVKAILETGLSDEALLKRLDQDSIRSVRIKTGKFEKGDNNFVDMTEWKTGLSDELKTNVDKGSVFVRIHKVLAPEPKALDEARGIITSDYQTELEKQWVNRLREKYPVTVDQKIFEKVKSNY